MFDLLLLHSRLTIHYSRIYFPLTVDRRLMIDLFFLLHSLLIAFHLMPGKRNGKTDDNINDEPDYSFFGFSSHIAIYFFPSCSIVFFAAANRMALFFSTNFVVAHFSAL